MRAIGGHLISKCIHFDLSLFDDDIFLFESDILRGLFSACALRGAFSLGFLCLNALLAHHGGSREWRGT